MCSCKKCNCNKELVGPEYQFSSFQCPNGCKEDKEELKEAVANLKNAANKALQVLRFARPTEKRTEIIKELETTINNCNDSLYE